MKSPVYIHRLKLLNIIWLLLILSACKKPASNNSNNNTATNTSTGSFTFTYTGFSQKPIRVFYHIPPTVDKKTMPILFVLHGDQRNAADYRDGCISLANSKKFMVFALEFSEGGFPDVTYAIGNVYSDGNNPTASSL